MRWNKGNPPNIGWYPARRARGDRGWENAWRWWDGECWSWPAFPHENEIKAAKWAAMKEPHGHNWEIIWGIK